MSKKLIWVLAAILVISGMVMMSCFSDDKKSMTVSPDKPDYRDSTQWYITDRGAAVDVFYIISTETGDYTMPDGEVCHFMAFRANRMEH